MTSFQNVVLYGAGGPNIGQTILDTLLADGTFNITVLARQSSQAIYASTIKVAKVPDTLPHAELVEALRGQDIVISAVGANGIASQTKVIDAAIEAGVKRFVPSEYGSDAADPLIAELTPIFNAKSQIQKYLETKVQAHPEFSWHAVATSIWLDWALDVKFIGIDPVAHTVTYWDNGANQASYTRLAYAGQSLLQSLKYPNETKNRRNFASELVASQREIVAELEKQQGVTYTVKANLDGAHTIKQAQDAWIASGKTDMNARFTPILGAILVEKYKGNFEKTQKPSLMDNFVQLPKLSLQQLVEEFLAKQRNS